MVGLHPKFGSIDELASVSNEDQKTLLQARKTVFRKIHEYEKKFPGRQGLIHADLHFRNIVSTGKSLAVIDFDDCGHGFFAYDLVIPYLSVQRLLRQPKADILSEYKNALLDGYRTKRKWDEEDEKIFPYLVTARKLAMLGWLNSRSDNPRLRKLFKGAVKDVLQHLAKTQD